MYSDFIRNGRRGYSSSIFLDVHMGCLRDRLSHNVPIETYQGREEWYQCQKELLLRIKKGFSVMKKDYSVNIP